MKYDVLRSMRDAALQSPTTGLMDATRAIQNRLQSLSGMQNPSGSPAAAPFGTQSDYVVRPEHRASESVIEGDFVQVDTAHDDVQPSASTDSVPLSDGEFTTDEFHYAGNSMSYRLYLPPTSTRNGALLVMLHGCTQDATDFSTGTTMNALARESGYTVLYPIQSAAANPNRCWNWFLPAHQRRSAGEPAVISALTSAVCKQYQLDSGRVFVAGLSAGGAMALVLAEEFPEIYAAVGVHSGLATGLASSVPQALRAMTGGNAPTAVDPACLHRPTMVIHGDQDKTVNPQNASHIVTRCLAQYYQHHPGEKLTSRSHDESLGGHFVQRHEYRNRDGLLVCRYWQLGQLAHAWSGGDPRGSHTAAGGLNASQSLLDFFDQCASLPT